MKQNGILIILLVQVSFFLNGCVSLTEYSYGMGRENGTIQQGEIVTLKKIKVDSEDYPAFKINRGIDPPKARHFFFGRFSTFKIQASILESDFWYVSHIYKGRYIIQSRTYNERQCQLRKKRKAEHKQLSLYARLSKRCTDRSDFGIWIDPNGNIDGSWVLLTSDTASSSMRKQLLVLINPKENDRWPDDIRFIPEF